MSIIDETLKYAVSYFQIVRPNNTPLSKKFKTMNEAVEALGSVADLSAQITKQTWLFYEADAPGRAELLAELQA